MYLTTNFERNLLSNYNENTFIKMDRYVQVLCMCYQFGEHLQTLHKKSYLATQKYDYIGSTWRIYYIMEITEVSVTDSTNYLHSV